MQSTLHPSLGVFMIHEEGIRCIGIRSQDIGREESSPSSSLPSSMVITCGTSGKVKVWRVDFSELLLEIELES